MSHQHPPWGILCIFFKYKFFARNMYYICLHPCVVYILLSFLFFYVILFFGVTGVLTQALTLAGRCSTTWVVGH
jgi:hypothetical protein